MARPQLHPFRPRLLDTLRGYDRTRFVADLGAGVTVGVVALTPTLRANLLNDRLTLRAVGRATEVRRIAEAAEFGQVLTELFGLRLPVSAAELFEQVPKGGDAPVTSATS